MAFSDIISRVREVLGLKEQEFIKPIPDEIIAKAREQIPTPTPKPTPTLSGYVGAKMSLEIKQLIINSAEKENFNPALLAALLHQETGGTFNPKTKGPGEDWGIAQINLEQHPQVKKEEALNPEFAIPWAARYLAKSMKKFGDINRTVASYNVGRGGANVKGPMPFGGGPLGQKYIDNVARNLDVETRKSLGLKTAY